MWTVRVKDRGRDLVWHTVVVLEEAEELRQVYQAMGYDPLKVQVERTTQKADQAA
jgi:hypothetical protein